MDSMSSSPMFDIVFKFGTQSDKKLEQNFEKFPLKPKYLNDCFERRNIGQVTYTYSHHLENFRYSNLFLIF